MKPNCRLGIVQGLFLSVALTGDATFETQRVCDKPVFVLFDDNLYSLHTYAFNATSLAAANPISFAAFFICPSSFLILIKWPGLNGSDG